MRNTLSTAPLLLLLAVGCDSRPVHEPELTAVNREALSRLGIADLATTDDGYALLDTAGEQVGQVTYAPGGSRVQLHDHVLSLEPTSATCNGESGDLDRCVDAMTVSRIAARPDHGVEAPTHDDLLGCQSDNVGGCVTWTAERGCLVSILCYVVWCTDGSNHVECTYLPGEW
jgi:hypothetical protein